MNQIVSCFVSFSFSILHSDIRQQRRMTNISFEEKVFFQFPSDLRVLAIDTDSTVLEFIKKICNEYCYQG